MSSRHPMIGSVALVVVGHLPGCEEYTCQDLANCPTGSSEAPEGGVGSTGDDAGPSSEADTSTSSATAVDRSATSTNLESSATTDDATTDTTREGTTTNEAKTDAGAEPSEPACLEVCTEGAVRCEGGAPQVCATGATGCENWVAHGVCTSCAAPLGVSPSSPIRGGYSGSLHADGERATLRPQLTWSSAEVECGQVVYQVQMDDSCAPGELDSCPFATPEVDVQITDARYQPDADLPVETEVPVGALYAWRVRACAWGTECSDWSNVAYLHVGRTEQDFNGDGYADMMLAGTTESGSVVEMYQGGRIFDAERDRRIELEYTLSKAPRFVGDVNGDGFADLALAEQANALCSSAGMNVGVIYGGPDSEPVVFEHLCRTQGTPSVMLGLAPAGDLSGDGYADIVVAHDLGSSENRVYVLEGGAPLPNTPTVDLDAANGAPYPHTETAGVALAGGGDFNGDSYADVVLSASGVSVELLTTRLFLGGETLPRAFADEKEYAGCTNNTWNALLQDINADGKSDWAVACSGSGVSQFGVIAGGQALPDLKSDVFTSDIALTTVSRALDFDNDGELEAIIGRNQQDSLIWRPEVFNPSAPEVFGDISYQATVTIADHDGDGRNDLGTFRSNQISSWAGSFSSFNITPVMLSVENDVDVNHMVF